MSEPTATHEVQALEAVREHSNEAAVGRATKRLVLFLRLMAAISLIKGLYHWSKVCGIGVDEEHLFAYRSIAWQVATVFFAVIDLVAAVGLWLVATWGAVIWLMAIASMLAVDVFFPQVFGGGLIIGMVEIGLLAVYLWLAMQAAKEQPP